MKIPRDHPAGTYWYHPHKHGSVTLQIASGMVGALIIRGDIDRVPAIQKAREHIFVFQQIPYKLNPRESARWRGASHLHSRGLAPAGRMGRRFTINGVVEPTYPQARARCSAGGSSTRAPASRSRSSW